MVAPAIIAGGVGAAADLLGGVLDNYFANEAADKAWKRQKKVLQNQIQWRVADATAAGLHPLAALGVNPASGPAAAAVGGMGSALSSMGQNIGRAVEAYMSPEEKAMSRLMAARAQLQQTQNNELQNAMLRAQVALLNQQLVKGPGSPGGKSDSLGGASVFGRVGWDNEAIPLAPGMNADDVEQYWGDTANEMTGASSMAGSMVRKNQMSSDGPFANRGGGWEGMSNDLARLRAWLSSWQVGL